MRFGSPRGSPAFDVYAQLQHRAKRDCGTSFIALTTSAARTTASRWARLVERVLGSSRITLALWIEDDELAATPRGGAHRSACSET